MAAPPPLFIDNKPHLVYRSACSETFQPMKLHFAINKHDLSHVKSLVNEDVNLNFKVFNQTPLEVAIFQECYDIACYLIDNGASLDFRESSRLKLTPLHLAAKSGCVELTEKMLKVNANLLHLRDLAGMTALHWAVLRNHREVVEVLVREGADVDSKDNKGMTPLCYSENLECVECLLALGASVDARTDEGNTALMRACSPHLYDIAQALLVKGNADPNITDRNGDSCLHLACCSLGDFNINFSFIFSQPISKLEKSQERLVRLLLKHGADVNSSNNHSFTPLQLTLSKNLHHLTLLLLDAGSLCSEDDQNRLHKLGISVDRPQSLMKLCKKHIRKHLGGCSDAKIDALDLPSRLRDFLYLH